MTDARHGTTVVLAGQNWDGVESTERGLALALATTGPVLWVDPPMSAVARLRGHAGPGDRPGLDVVAPGVTRMRILAPPFASRRPVAALTRWGRSRAVARAVRRRGDRVDAVAVFSIRDRFPAIEGVRVLYVTDDWPAGAALMGLRRSDVERALARSVRAAQAVVAVSPELAEHLADAASLEVIPNGVRAVPRIVPEPPRLQRHAILVGQLNERIDIEMLDALVEARIPLVVIGPRSDRDAGHAAALDRILAAESVQWLGRLSVDELDGHLQAATVGITPYADSDFNRASFPLKTLEYLASGLRTVATDLPAVRWLDTPLIAVGRTPTEFAGLVAAALAAPDDERERERRRAFGAAHGWSERADRFRDLVQRTRHAG